MHKSAFNAAFSIDTIYTIYTLGLYIIIINMQCSRTTEGFLTIFIFGMRKSNVNSYCALTLKLLTAKTEERISTYLLHSMSSFSSYVLEMRIRTTPLASARVMTMKPMIRSGLILIVLPSAVVVFVVFAVLIVVVVSSKRYRL